VLIRRERAGDIPAIDAVHRAAFAREYASGATGGERRAAGVPVDPPEVELVHRLRSDSGWIPTLSLVAEVLERVVGHVCLTRAGVGPYPVLALGPIGVLPEHQGVGIGASLMHAALGAADALDEPLVGLLDSLWASGPKAAAERNHAGPARRLDGYSLDYYPRFGFVPGARFGVVPDEPSWVSHFQVRPLTAYEPGITGEFRYPTPFYSI